MLSVQCAWCGNTVRGGDDWSGRTGKCPNCDAEVNFPVIMPPGVPAEPHTAPSSTESADVDRPLTIYEQVRTATFVTGLLAVLFGFGGYTLWEVLDGISTGVAFKPRRRSPTILLADDPFFFWVSQSLGFLLGCLFLSFGFGLCWIIARSHFKEAEDPWRVTLTNLLAFVTAILLLCVSVFFVIHSMSARAFFLAAAVSYGRYLANETGELGAGRYLVKRSERPDEFRRQLFYLSIFCACLWAVFLWCVVDEASGGHFDL